MGTSGWYNDESDPTLARWHDGTGWTDHVLAKADWEGMDHAPPPPSEPADLAPAAGARRVRMVVGSAAVLALLVVGGVALAQSGGDHPSERSPATGRTHTSTGAAGDGNVGSSTDASEGSVAPGDDATTVAPGTEGADEVTGGNSSTARNGTSRTTARTGSAGAVQHTETHTTSHTNTSPITQARNGDQSSVGNKNDTTISSTYVPPPPTSSTVAETTTTVADTTPSTTDTTDTTAP